MKRPPEKFQLSSSSWKGKILGLPMYLNGIAIAQDSLVPRGEFPIDIPQRFNNKGGHLR
jgi:hypothetical protein